MRIGGLQPVTLLDHPQKVAAIIFASGCNMRCPFCYNSSLVIPEIIEKSSFIPEVDLIAFLKKRKKYLDGIVLSGGEPTIQPDIKEFCSKVKAIGYDIKLDTNGLAPKILKELILEGLIDYIAMDIKGPIDNYKNFCGVDIDPASIRESIDLIINSKLPYEFRTTLVKQLHKEKDIEEMAKSISGAKLYYLQNFTKQDMLVDSNFSGRAFIGAEIEKFKNIAQKFVNNCVIR